MPGIGGLKPQLAVHRAHLGVAEMTHDMAERIAVDDRGRIGEDDDGAARLLDGVVEC